MSQVSKADAEADRADARRAAQWWRRVDEDGHPVPAQELDDEQEADR